MSVNSHSPGRVALFVVFFGTAAAFAFAFALLHPMHTSSWPVRSHSKIHAVSQRLRSPMCPSSSCASLMSTFIQFLVSSSSSLDSFCVGTGTSPFSVGAAS